MNAETPIVPDGAPAKTEEKEESLITFLLKVAVIMFILRSFIISPFSIPSESMMPTLVNGDYLLASKFPYGISKNSLPFNIKGFDGRIGASAPHRGDVVIFKHPVDGSDYIKRAIGLPGDEIEMRGGVVFINGKIVKKVRVADFVIKVTPNTACHFLARPVQVAGGIECHYDRFRETLPSGKSYLVQDFGYGPKDNFGPVTVPKGQLFVMGDNRDNSQDSRFPAQPGGGVGIVDQDLLVGRALIIMWSTDGSSQWYKPWTWVSALRIGRLGNTL